MSVTAELAAAGFLVLLHPTARVAASTSVTAASGGDNFIARSPLVVKARTVCVPNDPSRPWLRVSGRLYRTAWAKFLRGVGEIFKKFHPNVLRSGLPATGRERVNADMIEGCSPARSSCS